MTNSIFPIIIIVIIGFIVFSIIKKRKNKKTNQFLSMRKNKNEVWKTIKQFLKDNNEFGTEIINSFVFKRDYIDVVNPNSSFFAKKNKTFEIKIRNWQRKKINKQLQKLQKKEISPFPVKDIFVIIFTTKNNNFIQHRCIECEVINKKIQKNNYDRKIIINKELNYDYEMEWIAPIKEAQEQRNAIIDKKIAKQKEIEKKRFEKKLNKKRKKNNEKK